MFKLTARISLLLQQAHMAAFGLYFTSTLKGLNFSTKMPQKISNQIFFYTSSQIQHSSFCLLPLLL